MSIKIYGQWQTVGPQAWMECKAFGQVIKKLYVVMDREFNHRIVLRDMPSWMEENRKCFIQNLIKWY